MPRICHAILPDFDVLPEKNGETITALRIREEVLFLILGICGLNAYGLEIVPEERDEYFWPVSDLGFVSPLKILATCECSRTAFIQCEGLVPYIRGRIAMLSQKHCFRVEYIDALTHDTRDGVREIKSRPAVLLGEKLYFFCYTRQKNYSGFGPIIRIPNVRGFSLSQADTVPLYLPDPFVQKHIGNLGASDVHEVRKMAGDSHWINHNK